MPKHAYSTEPIRTDGMPPGVPYIVGNEAAERFSFYGMRCILVIFMTKHLMGAGGELAPMGKNEAAGYFHLFTAAVYFLPIVGGIVSDAFLGKYRTILYLSVVYCLGHAALAVDETRVGLFLGLALIAVGSGGIKSCVSAHVGDQFGPWNSRLIAKVFGWFYFAINLGAFVSTMLTPYLLANYGPGLAFGVPGIFMGLATLFFFMGRRKFAHIPPGGVGFLRETFSAEGVRALLRLAVIYLFVVPFWALFDQIGSSWVLQAEKMDRHLFGHEWEPSQISAMNPLLILVMIPLFSYVVYPLIDRVFPLTPLRKIAIGLFLAALSFAIPAWIEHQIVAGAQPSVLWQLLAYVVLTAAEVMVSITCLEFSYTQAPKKMKSVVMGLFLLSISLGNVLTAAVNFLLDSYGSALGISGPAYFWLFSGMMFVTAVGFIGVAANYREKTYLQGEKGEESEEGKEGEQAEE